MALTESQKMKLSRLSIARDGLSQYNRAASPTSETTVYIGLGGIGCETVNLLKNKTRNSYASFLAVDTDEHLLVRQIRGKADPARGEEPAAGNASSGNLTAPAVKGEVINPNPPALSFDETLCLYDQSMSGILLNRQENLPPFVKEWFNSGFPDIRLDSHGAQGMRQIGRLMLLAGSGYDALREKSTRLIRKAYKKACQGAARSRVEDEQETIRPHVRVVLISGLAGGTGSGILIDTAYLIRAVLDDMKIGAFADISAYLYTSDVLMEEQGIKGITQTCRILDRNTYASLKEIDYYLNLASNGRTYRLHTAQGGWIESRMPVFDACTIVSTSSVRLLTKQETMDVLTDYLMHDFGTAETEKSAASDGEETEAARKPTGSEYWTGVPEKPSAIRQAGMKTAAHPGYRMIGYSAVDVSAVGPETYFASRMLHAVRKNFRRHAGAATSDMVRDALLGAGLQSLETLWNHGLDMMATNRVDEQTRLLRPEWPVRSQIKSGTDGTRERADKLFGEYAKIVEAEDFRTRLGTEIKKSLDERIHDVENAYGPETALEFLTHDDMIRGTEETKSEGTFEGLIPALQNLIFELQTRSDMEREYGSRPRVQSQLARDKQAAGSLLATAGSRRIEEYVGSVCRISEHEVFESAYAASLQKTLTDVMQALIDENETSLRVCAEVLAGADRVLRGDLDLVATATKSNPSSGSLFSFYEIGKKSERLTVYLDDLINPASVRETSADIIQSIRDNHSAWTSEDDDFRADEEIRRCLRRSFARAVGKDETANLLIAAYSKNLLTAAQIRSYGESDSAEKKEAVSAAGYDIAAMLQHGFRYLGELRHQRSFDHEDVTMAIRVPAYLAEEVGKYERSGRFVETDDGSAEFVQADVLHGFPLHALTGFSRYADAYVGHRAIGLHRDEVNADWLHFPDPQ
ncbi:MAG: tubulin-like doman-containing protein [Chordicoccus sp.]|jgi:hypothetical protein